MRNQVLEGIGGRFVAGPWVARRYVGFETQFCLVATGTCSCPCSPTPLVQVVSSASSSPTPQGYSHRAYVLASLCIVLIGLMSVGTFTLWLGTLIYFRWGMVSLRRKKLVNRANSIEGKTKNLCAKLLCICGHQRTRGGEDDVY